MLDEVTPASPQEARELGRGGRDDWAGQSLSTVSGGATAFSRLW